MQWQTRRRPKLAGECKERRSEGSFDAHSHIVVQVDLPHPILRNQTRSQFKQFDPDFCGS